MSSDLLEAAKNGYYTQVLRLLSTGEGEVNACDKDRATPLYWSASRGHLQICQALLHHPRCDVNAKVKWGSTALHAAADRGHAYCLKLLIESGAEVNVQNERGDTALHLAAYRGFRDIVQQLVDCWADPFAKNSQSKTALQEAQSRQHSGAATVLQTYMESLGYRPFVSLPTTAQSEILEPVQENPGFSEAAKSWPHLRSFPRFPGSDSTPTHTHTPTDPTPRANTCPIMCNNLSEPRSSRPHSSVVMMSSGTAGEMVGCPNGAGTDTPPPSRFIPASPSGLASVYQDGGNLSVNNSRRYQHSEPTESVDDYCDNSISACNRNHAVTAQQYDDVDGLVNGDGHVRTQRPAINDTALDLLLNTVPPSTQSQGHYRTNGHTPNGQAGVTSSRPGWPPRAVAIHPPARPSPDSAGFLNKDDLALFAESLQLEVVRLRESVASKEKKVSELQEIVCSLESQYAGLQQQLLGKQHASAEMVYVRDRELSDLRRRVGALENQNANLQQALAAKQRASEEMFTMREEGMAELNRKFGTLERLNAHLEQVIVNKQEILKSTVVSKDREIYELNQRLAKLEREASAARRHVSSTSGWSPVHNRTGNTLGELMPRAAGHILDDTGRSCLEQPTRSMVSQSVTRTNDPPASSSTRMSDSPNRRQLQTNPSALVSNASHAVVGTDSMQSEVSEGDSQEVKSLKARVASLYLEDFDQGKLDADGREWSVDHDFVFLEDQPVNYQADGQRIGSCSLVFRIKHKQRHYVLKMLMNLINLHYDAHSAGRSLDAHLLQHFGAEFHAPLLLHAHPNIVRVRHHYQGDTTRFRTYLPLLVPATIDVPIDMARRTTFLVMDEYPLTLHSLVARVRGGNYNVVNAGNCEVMKGGKTKAMQVDNADYMPGATTLTSSSDNGDGQSSFPEQFLVHLLYQLLSAVEYLQRHHVVHRDIKADNVFMDWRLRPVLGDFGFARTVCGYEGEGIQFTDRNQVYAGNPQAWAPELSRLNRTGPEHVPQQMSLEQAYAKSDEFAVGRMFYSLLRADWEDEHSDNFPVSCQATPHYQDSAIPTLSHTLSPALRHVLRQLVLDDPQRRPSLQQAVRSAGVLLCRPKPGEVTSLGTAEVFCRAHLLKLADTSNQRPCQSEDGALSIGDSLAANQNQLEANFLLSLSYKEYWETLSGFRSFRLL